MHIEMHKELGTVVAQCLLCNDRFSRMLKAYLKIYLIGNYEIPQET